MGEKSNEIVPVTLRDLFQGKNVFEPWWTNEKAQWLRKNIRQGKSLVTGACGSIGSVLLENLWTNKRQADGIDQHEEAVALHSGSKYGEVFLGQAWDYPGRDLSLIFHCAAYKHVKLAERFPSVFYENNVVTCERMVNLMRDQRDRPTLVLCSTDKATGPSHLGRTKRKAEALVCKVGGTALRLVNCFGSKGSVIDLWNRGILKVGPAGVERFWMSLQDAALALLIVSVLPPGLYTVTNVPKFNLGELWQAWAAFHGKDPLRFEGCRMGTTESMKESLFDPKNERLEETEVPFLARIVPNGK